MAPFGNRAIEDAATRWVREQTRLIGFQAASLVAGRR